MSQAENSWRTQSSCSCSFSKREISPRRLTLKPNCWESPLCLEGADTHITHGTKKLCRATRRAVSRTTQEEARRRSSTSNSSDRPLTESSRMCTIMESSSLTASSSSISFSWPVVFSSSAKHSRTVKSTLPQWSSKYNVKRLQN